VISGPVAPGGVWPTVHSVPSMPVTGWRASSALCPAPEPCWTISGALERMARLAQRPIQAWPNHRPNRRIRRLGRAFCAKLALFQWCVGYPKVRLHNPCHRFTTTLRQTAGNPNLMPLLWPRGALIDMSPPYAPEPTSVHAVRHPMCSRSHSVERTFPSEPAAIYSAQDTGYNNAGLIAYSQG
jgi:hypothetical protein